MGPEPGRPRADRRRPGHAPGGRRDAILDAAMDEFADGGYNGTSLAKVADRAGLTQQGLLHYFPSKPALLIGVLERRDELDRSPDPEDAWGGDEDPEDSGERTRGLGQGAPHDVGGLLEEIVRRNTKRAGIVQAYTILSAESVTHGHPAHAYFQERFERLRGTLAAQLRDEHGEVLPSGAGPEDAAALLLAAMDGLQVQWLHDRDSVDMPSLITSLTAALVNGGTA